MTTLPEANDDMVQGYRDGRDMDCPEPTINRSHSYHHGFAVGRCDKAGEPAFGNAALARTLAELAMKKDASL